MAVQSSFRNMSVCLLVICLVCSTLLAGVYALTKEPIDVASAAKNQAAIMEVLPPCASVEEERSVDMDGQTYTYNLAYDDKGDVAGCAVNVSAVGFGGPVIIKVGFDKDGVIWNTKVLSQSETPGLGAKCVEPLFADQFKGFDPAQKKLAVKKDGGDVDAITASTITSRAYVSGLAQAVRVLAAIAGTPMLLPDASTGATSGAAASHASGAAEVAAETQVLAAEGETSK